MCLYVRANQEQKNESLKISRKTCQTDWPERQSTIRVRHRYTMLSLEWLLRNLMTCNDSIKILKRTYVLEIHCPARHPSRCILLLINIRTSARFLNIFLDLSCLNLQIWPNICSKKEKIQSYTHTYAMGNHV